MNHLIKSVTEFLNKCIRIQTSAVEKWDHELKYACTSVNYAIRNGHKICTYGRNYWKGASMVLQQRPSKTFD